MPWRPSTVEGGSRSNIDGSVLSPWRHRRAKTSISKVKFYIGDKYEKVTIFYLLIYSSFPIVDN